MKISSLLGTTAISSWFYRSKRVDQATVDREGPHCESAHVTSGRNVSVVCGGSGCVGESAPVEAFSLLANEDRLAILKAVVRTNERSETPISFSTLGETVEVRDSGRFSYHLQELTDRFLIRSSEGYSLHEDCCDRFVDIIASIDI